MLILLVEKREAGVFFIVELLLLNMLAPLFKVPNILFCPLLVLKIFLESYWLFSFGLNKLVDLRVENIPIPLN